MLGPFSIPASWIVLGVLIATSSSLMGLLAIWAAWSPRHWFFRTAAVGGVLLLAVPIPAYELMLVFLIQAIVVTAALTVVEARRERCPRFSLSTLLLLVAIVAVAFAVGARIPAAAWAAWVPIGGVGICLGVITLLATWAAQSGRRPWIRAIVFLSGLLPLAIPLGWAIFSFPNIDLLGWQSIEWLVQANNIISYPREWIFYKVVSVAIWTFVVAWLTGFLVVVCLLLAPLVIRATRNRTSVEMRDTQPSHTPSRWATPAGLALALLTLAMLLPSAVVYWPLVNPTPKPEVVLPSPNAYDGLVQAGTALTSNVISNYGTAGQAALQSEITNHAAALVLAHNALEREFRWPLIYGDDDFQYDGIQAFRHIAWAFTAEAGLAKMDGRIDDAVRSHVDTMRLGFAAQKGGLLAHSLVGIAISGLGADGLVGLRDQVSPAQAKDLVARLEKLAAKWEPMDGVIAREHVWSEHAYGWVARLGLAMEKVTGDSIIGPAVEAARNASGRSATQLQLLIADLAVRGYQLEHGELPATLSILVPNYIAAVPYDPYGDGPLTYRVTDDGYLLYSVWQDGDDDGGRSVPRDELWSDGDFLVDTLYQQQPSATGQTQPVKKDADDGAEVE